MKGKIVVALFALLLIATIVVHVGLIENLEDTRTENQQLRQIASLQKTLIASHEGNVTGYRQVIDAHSRTIAALQQASTSWRERYEQLRWQHRIQPPNIKRREVH